MQDKRITTQAARAPSRLFVAAPSRLLVADALTHRLFCCASLYVYSARSRAPAGLRERAPWSTAPKSEALAV